MTKEQKQVDVSDRKFDRSNNSGDIKNQSKMSNEMNKIIKGLKMTQCDIYQSCDVSAKMYWSMMPYVPSCDLKYILAVACVYLNSYNCILLIKARDLE